MEDQPIKVGVITDQTGPLSFMGIANANVATHGDRRHQRAAAACWDGRSTCYLEDSETDGQRRRRPRPPSSSSRITST